MRVDLRSPARTVAQQLLDVSHIHADRNAMAPTKLSNTYKPGIPKTLAEKVTKEKISGQPGKNSHGRVNL